MRTDTFARPSTVRGMDALSLTERVVLGVVAEGTTHGFGVARELAEGGPLGRIWTVRRPLVYRAIEGLERAGLVEDAGEAPGGRGPTRRLVRATTGGGAAVEAWLQAPVEHVRDVRTELLLKLALLDRAGRPADELVTRQREHFRSTLAGLRAGAATAEGFDAVLARWRLESAEAVERFLAGL